MVNTQCEQITKTQSLVLKHKIFDSIISVITTRSGEVIQGPKGPPEWEESQRQKERETQEMSQEVENLIDPEDEVEQIGRASCRERV